MISGRQIREARALLKWGVPDLGKRSGVDEDVIRRAENVDGTPGITLFQAGLIQQAFERAGLRFGRGGGVLMAAARNSPDDHGVEFLNQGQPGTMLDCKSSVSQLQ